MKHREIRIGLAMWSHSYWRHSMFGGGLKQTQRLERYAQYFNTVEGNTTFYALPSTRTVRDWNLATPDEFQFTFKLPMAITHRGSLVHKKGALLQFLDRMMPLSSKLGMWSIQLPVKFSPYQLQDLALFLEFFPKHPTGTSIGIEVRHPLFFSKGKGERDFNQWLVSNSLNRIIVDSRPIFSVCPTSSELTEAQRRKPRVPVRAIATASQPVVRFIGLNDPGDNDIFLAPWVKKLSKWTDEKRSPYFFIHTVNNQLAPELAHRLYERLSESLRLPPRPKLLNWVSNFQPSLF